MIIMIYKCELCEKEYRNDEKRHWSDCIHRIDLNFKNHPGLQNRYELDVCTDCGRVIVGLIESSFKTLKKGIIKEEQAE